SAILDYEQVRIENRRVFCPDRFRNALLHLKDLHTRLDKRRLEPPDFIRNPGRRDPVTHHLIQIIAHDMNPAEDDSGRNANSFKPDFRSVAHPLRRVRQMSSSRKFFAYQSSERYRANQSS